MRRLGHEGDVRRIVVKDTQARVVLDVPVSAGIVAACLPWRGLSRQTYSPGLPRPVVVGPKAWSRTSRATVAPS
ncbi:DUF4342 domain-containing protein [Amycolatopsis sp. EV170708-02-1]|uniref:DUF4342 domain-containing protein n=1 Tax=Amycolatopsis sp. EV170708-02-1 TaxID=2919322 RepID=UPI001F0C451B|nr:DUF4342 domain-containing protein [Amycolatopsis sp. EV170708-02-1]UMP07256.1 DUF4342 domain-containing protein [Amycolatopsis sp. EV170708-02-1]